jgi:hypothetical protein
MQHDEYVLSDVVCRVPGVTCSVQADEYTTLNVYLDRFEPGVRPVLDELIERSLRCESDLHLYDVRTTLLSSTSGLIIIGRKHTDKRTL